MRKLTAIWVLLFVLILVFSANAQQIQIGVVGGLNFSDLTLTSDTGRDLLTSSRTLFGAGGVLELNLGDIIRFNVEPMYLQKGGTQKATNGDPDVQMKFAFLEIPLFVKLTFGKTIRPYIKAGPSIGFLLSAKAEAETGGVVSGGPLQVYKADLKDVMTGLDFGVTVGAGVSVLLKRSTIFLDGRYSMGLKDLWKGGTVRWESGTDSFDVESSEAGELATKGFQIMVGIIFPLSGE
jgi:hypothetical protein